MRLISLLMLDKGPLEPWQQDTGEREKKVRRACWYSIIRVIPQ